MRKQTISYARYVNVIDIATDMSAHRQLCGIAIQPPMFFSRRFGVRHRHSGRSCLHFIPAVIVIALIA